jgi:hypothetical protein
MLLELLWISQASIDVDGTTNLDVVDVDGAVDFAVRCHALQMVQTSLTASAGGAHFRAGVNAGSSIAEAGGNDNTVVGDASSATAITAASSNTATGATDALVTVYH